MHVCAVAVWRRNGTLPYAAHFWVWRGKGKTDRGREVVLTRANPLGINGGAPYMDEAAARELRWRSSKPTKASLKGLSQGPITQRK